MTDISSNSVVTINKNPDLDGVLHIPYAGETGINKQCPINFWLTPEEPDGTENEILLEVADMAWDMYTDIAI